MNPAMAANLVVAAHFTFILFAVFGAILVLRWPRFAWLHLPALVWAGGIMITGGVCPLTPIENRLRLAEPGGGYAGGFIDHYIMPIIYPPGLTHAAQLAGAALLFGCNALVYVRVWHLRQQRSHR
jgi:hypothetical protein